MGEALEDDQLSLPSSLDALEEFANRSLGIQNRS